MKKMYFLLLLATAVVFAAQTATVTGLDPNGDGFLSLRKKPKQREIGKLYNGDKVEILSQSGKYYKVKDVKSGMIGYAHSNWIRKTSHSTTASTSTSQKQGTVHGLDPNGDGFLSVRSKPKGKEIGKLYNGNKVAILGQRGAWYKVRTSGGLVGWSHGDWIGSKILSQKNTSANSSLARWQKQGDVVVDTRLGLMWQDNTAAKSTKKKWKSAKKYCKSLTLAGYSDWYLPNYDELLSIVDYDRYDPAIMPSFKNVASSYYWSSSQDVSGAKYAWFVHFKLGDTGSGTKSNEFYVRCVRHRQ